MRGGSEDRLQGGGGGGTSGGMEDRVKKLENSVDRLRDDMADVRVNLATLTERVAHLPSKGFIVAATSSAIGLAMVIVTFGEKLRAMFSG